MNIHVGTSEIKNICMGPSNESMQGPCASGFHVPSNNENVALVVTLTALGIDTSNGNCMKTYLKMPFAGYRVYTNANVFGQGTKAGYWSSNTSSTVYARIMSFDSSVINSQNSEAPASGFSIRPFKNSPTVPTNSWTTLYSGTGDAGIFHDTVNGLISMSSDGTNWITIADKNLGATTVYNDGDTLSQNNCGKYYQRGNNYGFPRTGSVTTSSTSVDASTYGPGNHYSSSTFITASSRDSSNNGNLRGGQYTPLKSVYVGTTKVRPTQLSDERIEIKMMADNSGNLKIPVAGVSASGSRNSPYNWKVSVDGGTATTKSGTGSDTPITVATGLVAGTEHTVMITPTTEAYGWARAFGFYNSGIGNLLSEVVYDGSYMGYASSATNTGNYFRSNQYRGCTALTSAPVEVLPNTVTTVGNNFRSFQYMGCQFTTAPAEVLPDTVTSIGDYFRGYQYNGCTRLTTTPAEALSSSATSIGTNFRYQQYYGCTGLTTVPGIKATPTSVSKGSSFRTQQFSTAGSTTTPMNVTINGTNIETSNTNSLGLANNNVAHVYVASSLVTAYKNSSDWSYIDDAKFLAI